MGRIQSDASIKLAGETLRRFGSWTAVHEAAVRNEDGVLVIKGKAPGEGRLSLECIADLIERLRGGHLSAELAAEAANALEGLNSRPSQERE